MDGPQVDNVENSNQYLPPLLASYRIGREKALNMHAPAELFLEYELVGVNSIKLQHAINDVVKQYEITRSQLSKEGYLRFIENVPEVELSVLSTTSFGIDSSLELDKRLDLLRQYSIDQVLDPYHWPAACCFSLVNIDDRNYRLYCKFSLIFLDGLSIRKILINIGKKYFDVNCELPVEHASYYFYLDRCKEVVKSQVYLRDAEYWKEKVSVMGPALTLPSAHKIHDVNRSEFLHFKQYLPKECLMKLSNRADRLGTSVSIVLLSAFSIVLSNWSEFSKFFITMMIQKRKLHYDSFNSTLGNMSSTMLINVDVTKAKAFSEFCMYMHIQCMESLLHSRYCGVEVLKDKNKIEKNIGSVASPVAFVSTMDFEEPMNDAESLLALHGKNMIWSSLQTPQIGLDCQMTRNPHGELVVSWAVENHYCPKQQAQEMFNVYCGLLTALSESDDLWSHSNFCVTPKSDMAVIERVNATQRETPKMRLEEGFYEAVKQSPTTSAILTENETITYKTLSEHTRILIGVLNEVGAKEKDIIAIYMGKDWRQIASVLSVLSIGAVYLPIDVSLPEKRVSNLLSQCDVSTILTLSNLKSDTECIEYIRENKCTVLLTDKLLDQSVGSNNVEEFSYLNLYTNISLAYVIFTSGSTGLPKGVVLDHAGPVNTIIAINNLINLTSHDRIFAISSLSFDLSVYDIFAPLMVGAAIVMPQSNSLANPEEWLDLLHQHQVTVWNSAPALMLMLCDYCHQMGKKLPESLRVVMLSGDWIPLDLKKSVDTLGKNITFISLGGATEASIWSIYYIVNNVNKMWSSIPYGFPLANQRFYILDDRYLPKPIGVPGELCIAGLGLAQGYWNNQSLTDRSFVTNPHTGERIYKTGDIGRYRENGEIELLGRKDEQVKIKGYRIELGEIEAVLNQHPNVSSSIVLMVGKDTHSKQLVAYVVPIEPIDQDSLKRFISSYLPQYMVPTFIYSVDGLPVTVNGKINRKTLLQIHDDAKHYNANPNVHNDNSESESSLKKIWAAILQHPFIKSSDDFFEIGGDSFLAIRLITEIMVQFDKKLSFTQILNNSTLRQMAALIEVYPVNIDKKSSALITELYKADKVSNENLYFIHPAGGTVVCYTELVDKLQKSYSVYGIQSPGVVGGQPVAGTVSDVAVAYLKEIETHGLEIPSRIVGWSFGGLVAVEIAHVLQSKGIKVRQVILIDTPLPMQDLVYSDYDLVNWFFTDIFSNNGFDETEDHRDKNSEELLAIYLEIAQNKGILSKAMKTTILQPMYDTFSTNVRLMRLYELRKLPSYIDVTHIRASGTIIKEFQKHKYVDDAFWGWKPYLPESAKAIELQASHYSIVKEPNLGVIANVIDGIENQSDVENESNVAATL